jgi:predicted PurR-regulated permease PerM
MFGLVGILLAIPGVTILDMLYKEYFMPWLEARRKTNNDLQT